MNRKDDKAEQYPQRFGEWPRLFSGMTQERLDELIECALKRGTPITDDEYSAHLPPGAVA